MKVVISIGGSILASPTPNLDYIKSFSNLLIKLHKEGYKLMVVVGGGRIAKDYISSARELGASEEYCDEIGIRATRMNAMLLTIALGEYASKTIPEDFETACRSSKIFLMGGIEPGQTTDAVAAKLAVECDAELLINATNVDGIYDSDPKENPSAKRYATLTSEQLLKIVGEEHRAGLTVIIDPVAAKVIHKNKIKTIVVDGRKLENIENAIKGKKHGGTVVMG
jgi:uridylate kinase